MFGQVYEIGLGRSATKLSSPASRRSNPAAPPPGRGESDPLKGLYI